MSSSWLCVSVGSPSDASEVETQRWFSADDMRLREHREANILGDADWNVAAAKSGPNPKSRLSRSSRVDH